MTNVVIVESPAKVKTINRYLGSDFQVLASYGHIRDLPSKNGSVDPDNDFAMRWEIDAAARKRVGEIAKAVKGADKLYLATDPDREGEAISWHVREVLNDMNLLGNVEVKRVVFNEITKDAILEAFANPRELDQGLIEAYLARRALDYLVGFTLSPILWRKLPGSRSAGRVQSVALRLICDREFEIEAFKPREYWTIAVGFRKNDGRTFSARLTHLGGEKLDRFDIADEALAGAAAARIEALDFTVAKIERKQTRRHPAAPFTTSTLQQEAARKLHFSTKRTMQVAQKLYEGFPIGGETVGLITYMRTDSVQIAGVAVGAIRGHIETAYGNQYLPQKPRAYKTRAKNAQEAHEAIRPTDITRTPGSVGGLDSDHARLYELIWKRTAASQMDSAVIDQVAVDFTAAGNTDGVVLRATGSVIAFDGCLKLYQEGRDDAENEDGERILPNLDEGEALARTSVEPEQHFTQPPPRFSEASLVKNMEELGIGRPSTYASIISVLQDRDYVRLEARRFTPEDRGRLVTAFLTSFFARYVEYGFTADLENQLDEISSGRGDWKHLLRQFWEPFSAAVAETTELRIRDVLDALNDVLGSHFFGADDGGKGDARACLACAGGQLSLKVGKFGAFIGCSNYPDCRYTRPLVTADGDGSGPGVAEAGPKALGNDPDTGLEVTLRKGPYGYYIQLGEGGDGTKPKRSSLAKGMDPAALDLQRALGLLSLPRDIGADPEDGEMIQAGLGRFGPYIKRGGTYVSLKEDDVLSIGLNRAIVLMADAPKRPAPETLGNHPGDGKPVTLRSGRYGPYVQHGQLRATLPRDRADDKPSLEAALELLAAKAAKSGKGGKKAKPKSKAKLKAKAKPKAKTKPKTRKKKSDKTAARAD